METKFAYQMNQFAPTSEIKGRLDLQANLDSYAGLVDSTQATALKPGDPVAIVSTSTKLPHFVKATVGSVVMGFVKWTAKKAEYAAGDMVEVSYANDVMYMEANTSIGAGVAVNVADLTNVRIAKAGASKSIIGYSMESASAQGDLIRVRITAPVALTANS